MKKNETERQNIEILNRVTFPARNDALINRSRVLSFNCEANLDTTNYRIKSSVTGKT